ncbi:hypothetical protein L198_02138 [Cryptococcus wingfieldii CBS 7118]|uniref:Protein ZIP4 homolog n=1 Tax=Cryptococcus wingfieldii CBS 7118 TaxID=1295528 RepID=A0A1E3JX77_9TREE|nr:hypothetical protein L198_02138 [Cryptococcus wingfieldii CBS 7118]ODO05445.1 hypothetical protein L198_02138 [Cryptococcus wingfieldii CBS 7118]
MAKDAYVALRAPLPPPLESLEHARPHFTTLLTSPSSSQNTRLLLKALDGVQEAVHAFLKHKKSRKKKDGDGSGEAEQVKVDWLDTEGVQLWNLASQVGRTTPVNPTLSKADIAIVAACKLTGYRILEAATDTKGPMAFVVRLLGLTAKTMSALLDAGKTAVASQLAVQGAEFEQTLLSATDPQDSGEIKQQVSSLVWFYCARIDLLLKEGNDTFAFDIFLKAIALDEMWSLTPQEATAKCWTVGNTMLQNKTNLPLSIDWLKQGIMLVEKMVNRGLVVDRLEELHLTYCIARAQMMQAEETPQSLQAATATLNELAQLVGEEDQITLREMRVLQLHVLKRSKAPENEVKLVLEDLMKMQEWTEEKVIETLSQLASLMSDYPTLPSTSAQTFLRKALSHPDGHPHVQLIIYEGLLFAKSLSPPALGIRTAVAMLDIARKHGEYRMEDKVNVVACQTLLWNIANFNGNKERITESAHWYQLAGHDLFRELGGENTSRCLRKAALCHIKTADWGAAHDLIARCPTDEASTHYLTFLAAIRQGEVDRQQAAIDAVSSIVECSDFEAQQLVLMTHHYRSLANEKGAQPVLLASMRALLSVLTDSEMSFEVQIETITVIRCLVRMSVLELAQAEDKERVVDSILEYLQTAVELLTEDPSIGQGQTKGIAWLYKCAFNVAVQGLHSLSSKSLADLFDRSAQLMTIYEVIEPMSTDPDLPFVRGSAMFACLCGKIFLCKDLPTGPDKILLLDQLLEYIPQCRNALQGATNTAHPRYSSVSDMLRIIDTSEVELQCEAREWTAIPEILERLKDASKDREVGTTHRTLEMIANVLVSTVTYRLLEIILDICPTRYADDIKRFSRWMRAILRILLHRSGADDESAAFSYVSRALDVLKTPLGKTAYPLDEAHWLVATAWNRGLEWFSSSRVQQAKQWCEAAMTMSSFSPDLKVDRQKMHEHYQHLLDKMSS